MKGTEVAKLTNEPYFLNLDDPSWTEVIKEIPEWQAKLVNTDSGIKNAASITEDDIPFSDDDEEWK